MNYCFRSQFLFGIVITATLSHFCFANGAQAQPLQNSPTQQDQNTSYQATFTAEELEQIILALDLFPTLGLVSQKNRAATQLNSQLRALKSSSPQQEYQLSSQQSQQLQQVLSSIPRTKLEAVNYLLRSQNRTGEMELTAQEVEGVVKLLTEVPREEFSAVQKEQLGMVLDFFQELPQYRSSRLSSEQTQALQGAIALLFFPSQSASTASSTTETSPPTEISTSSTSSTTETSQATPSSTETSPPPTNNVTPSSETETSQPDSSSEEEKQFSEPITISKTELQQILSTLQGIQALNLSSPINLSELINEFLGLLVTPEQEVELSPQQRQQVSTVLNSLSPEETAEVDEYLASESVGEQFYLSQSAIANTLEFLENLSEADLTSQEETARQELIKIFEELAAIDQPAIQLSPEQIREINTLTATLPKTTPEAVTVEREQLEEALSAIGEIPPEILSPEQREAQNRLTTLLESVSDTEKTSVELSSTQIREINQLRAALPQFDANTELVERDRVLTILETAREQSLSEEQIQQLEALQTYFESQQPLTEETTLTPVETEQVEKLNAFIDNLSRSQITQIGQALGTARGISPGITVENPSGFGGAHGSISLGAVFQNRTRFTNSSDGSVGTSLSLGNPNTAVGATATLTSFSLLEGRGSEGGFMDNGSLSFEVNRNLSDLSSVGIGVENLIPWGQQDSGTSTYLTFSQGIPLRSDTRKPFGIAYVTAGLGNGRFRPEEDFDPENDGTQFNFFGNATLQLLNRTNLIVEWGGQDLNVGLSIVPFANIPIVITPAIVDITGSAGDGERFTLGVSYGTIFEF